MTFLVRIREYKAFFYRLFLAFLFYQIARVLFYVYNADLLEVDSLSQFLKLCFRGVNFDMPAIFYTNSLFILLSLLPLLINHKKGFQKVLFYCYFIPNLIAYALNFVDFVYYRFTLNRTTTAALESVQNETNKVGLFFTFLADYWHAFVLYVLIAWLWVFLYKRVTIKEHRQSFSLIYVLSSVVVFLGVTTLIIGGIRGDFKHSTRPINLVDANRHVDKNVHANIVLNTPFAVFRTIGKNYFKKVSVVDSLKMAKVLQPVKTFNRKVTNKPNIVIFIIESYGREYIGAFNKHKNIPNYKSYSPFLDSLSQQSLIFPNAFANGRKSIHGMSSVLAGIPSFKVAYTSSPYSNQKSQSVVSVLNDMDYDTSFFHGAPNGSMGFLGYGNILGFDHYYGKTEYNNDKDFDGLWGIWDKPFLQFMKKELDKKKNPFMATVFTVTSHSPYVIPEEDMDKYDHGSVPIHKCVGYTDNAIREFFNSAKKEPWFDNTVFIFTADHTNQKAYPTYNKTINQYAVPMIIYSPKGTYKGVNMNLAQQIDIYPTIADITGYNKPIRSWGRSLLNDTIVKPYAFIHTGTVSNLLQDSLIYSMDMDLNKLNIFDVNDFGLEHPLNNVPADVEAELELKSKSFIQDYMNRIIDKKLSVEK